MRKIGIYNPIPTAEESYNHGYEIGVDWVETYTPAGPATFHAREWEKEPNWAEWCAATQQNRREWLRGFDDARAAKKD